MNDLRSSKIEKSQETVRTVSAAFFLSTDTVAHARSERSQAEITSFNAWFKALFDSSSEGIEDNILR